MRRYIIGGLIGAALATSFNASAAVEAIIGKAVEGTAAVKLNGQKLDKDSIIVDGSSYAPVRAIGEALGLNVDFKNSEVVLDQKKEAAPVVENPVVAPQPETPKQSLGDIEKQIESIKESKAMKEQTLRQSEAYKKGFPQTDIYDKEIELYKSQIKEFDSKIAELEKQKAELTK